MAKTVNDLNLCFYTTYCNIFGVEDNTEWADTDEVTEIIISITDGETTATYTYDTVALAEIENGQYAISKANLGDLIESDSLKDGFYDVTVTITYVDHADADAEYTLVYTKDFQSFCKLKCIIKNLIIDSLDDECSDCHEKEWDIIYEYMVRNEMLCSALACGDLNLAETIYDNLYELLINFNCKNC